MNVCEPKCAILYSSFLLSFLILGTSKLNRKYVVSLPDIKSFPGTFNSIEIEFNKEYSDYFTFTITSFIRNDSYEFLHD